MRDLDLWRRISTAAVTADEIGALAERPLAGRVAWFGALAALVDRADPALRAAALRALAGATGVPGLRAITARLDDDDEAVRAAAVDALRHSARDARCRYAHALFHPRADVRRRALADLPAGTAEMAVYLRGDPECAELAARVPWPPGALRLALDLHAAGRLAHGELVELIEGLAPGALQGALVVEHGRSPAQIERYLRDAARAPVRPVAPGSDALDAVVAAIAGIERSRGASDRRIDRLIDHLVETFSPGYPGLTVRAVVALLSQLARALIALCVAIRPGVLEHASFDPADAAAAARGLIRSRWPHRPAADHVERILRRPVVRGDLALAAAVAGLLPGKRLAALAAVLGEAAIVDALRAGDHGWDAICRLPPEAPPRELGWLAQLADHPERFVALAAIALAIFGDRRREAFIDWLPPDRTAAAFMAFARSPAAGDGARLAAVCEAIAPRVAPAAIPEILTRLLDGAGAAVLALARAVTDVALAACVRRLDDRSVAPGTTATACRRSPTPGCSAGSTTPGRSPRGSSSPVASMPRSSSPIACPAGSRRARCGPGSPGSTACPSRRPRRPAPSPSARCSRRSGRPASSTRWSRGAAIRGPPSSRRPRSRWSSPASRVSCGSPS